MHDEEKRTTRAQASMLEKFFAMFQMRVAFLDYGHYSTPVAGELVPSIDDKWTSYCGVSTVICCDNDRVVTPSLDENVLLQRLAAHYSVGGALISTSDFNVPFIPNSRGSFIKTSAMSCFGMNAGTEVISNMGVSGDTYFEMTMALISTRTITELKRLFNCSQNRANRRRS